MNARTVKTNLIVALLLGGAIASAAALAEAARVMAFAGQVNASDASGATRALTENAAVDGGDTVVTGAESAAQLRFTDGALLFLRADSQFRVDSYRYQANSPRENGFFSLLKGSLRTLSGLIGKVNKENYRVRTAVATVGIRGTDYSLRLCQDDCLGADNGLYLNVVEGAINASNNAGSFDLHAGQSGYIRDATTPLIILPNVPEVLDAADDRLRFYSRYTLDPLFGDSTDNPFEFRGGDLIRCVP